MTNCVHSAPDTSEQYAALVVDIYRDFRWMVEEGGYAPRPHELVRYFSRRAAYAPRLIELGIDNLESLFLALANDLCENMTREEA